MKLKFFLFFTCLFVGMQMQAADGDIFTAQTAEGVDMTFKIISEEENTVQVGTGVNNTPAIADSIEGVVTIPNIVEWGGLTYSVLKLGNYAFAGCSKITNYVIPENVVSIGNYTFFNNSSLTEVTIPESVTNIGFGAFQSSGLKSVTIPTSITELSSDIFRACPNLETVDLPSGLRSIAKNAFYWSRALTSIILPESLEDIGAGAFQGCSALSKVIARMQNPFALGGDVFTYINGNCSLHVPDGTKDAYIEAGWTSSVFGGGVVYGDDTPILGQVIVVANEDGIDIKYKVLDVDSCIVRVGDGQNNSPAIDSSTEGSLAIPSTIEYFDIIYKVTSLGDYAFSACSKITNYVIPETVVSIGNYTFLNNSSLTEITIPESVTSMGSGAFQSSGLKSVTIPTSITELSSNIFRACPNLEAVYLPNGLRTIGANAFYWSRALTSIVLPETLEDIGAGAFQGCSALSEVIARMQNPFTLGSDVFTYINANCGLHIPDGTREAYIEAGWTKEIFGGGIVYGDDTPTKGNRFSIMTIEGIEVLVAILDTDEMTVQIGTGSYPNTTIDPNTAGTITIPSTVELNGQTYTVKHIASYAFAECERLTEVYIPGTVTDIYMYSFYGCTSLQAVNMEEGVKALGYAAIYGCTSLKSLMLPSTITYLGDYALGDNTALKDLYANMPAPCETKENTFYNISNLKCILHVPEGTRDAYLEAGWTEGEDGIFLKVVEGEGEPMEGTEFTIITIEGVEVTLMITSMDNLTCQIGSGEKNDPCVDYNTTGTVTIPSTAEYQGKTFTITTVGDRAFRYTTVGEVILPETVKTVIQYAFANCDSLRSVSLPEGVTSIGMAAFYKCPNLTEINLPDSLTTVGNYAFANSGLTTVTLPAGVTTIGRNAFASCGNLKWMVVEMPTPPELGTNVFDGIDPECVLIVPAGTKEAYKAAGWDTSVFGGNVYESIPEYLHDVNKDGTVDINDVVSVINHIAGTDSYPKADVNQDGTVDINDVVSIINFMAGADTAEDEE